MYYFYVDEDEPGIWEREVFVELFRYLNRHHLKARIRNRRSFAVTASRWWRSKAIEVELGHKLAVLQNSITGRYSVIDGSDWVTPFDIDLPAIAHDRRCAVILKCQYEPEPYRKPPLTKIRPWTYFETHTHAFQDQLEEYRRIDKHRKPLFFRGNVSWAQRQPILDSLVRRGLVNEDFDDWVSYDQYARELGEHKLALALEGMGNVCHREIEAFGLGTPILMPRLKNQFHDPLLPDHHYVAIDAKSDHDDPEEVADKIQSKYEEVVNNQDYLDQIAENAMGWYERNVRMPASLKLASRLMGFER